jgi:hypothetical protein
VQAKEIGTPFAAIDAGASETSFLFGLLRGAKAEERAQGHDRMIEHLEPVTLPWLGGERMLHRLAYRTYVKNLEAMRAAGAHRVPGRTRSLRGGRAISLAPSPEARANTLILRDALRPILEQSGPSAGAGSR